MKTKIGTEVAHVARDSDTTFKVKGQGHQAALVACSSHYLTYMDDNIFCATAQSELLPVDLGAGAYHGGRPPTACIYEYTSIPCDADLPNFTWSLAGRRLVVTVCGQPQPCAKGTEPQR